NPQVLPPRPFLPSQAEAIALHDRLPTSPTLTTPIMIISVECCDVHHMRCHNFVRPVLQYLPLTSALRFTALLDGGKSAAIFRGWLAPPLPSRPRDRSDGPE